MGDAVEIDDAGLRELATALQKSVTLEVDHDDLALIPSRSVEIDDAGLREVATTLQMPVTRTVSHAAERNDPIPQATRGVASFGKLTFEQWSRLRQEEWRQSTKKKTRS